MTEIIVVAFWFAILKKYNTRKSPASSTCLETYLAEQSPVAYDVLGGVKMNFSDNLKIIRQQKKMTQTDIATQLHVSRQTISSWENGRSYPDIGMLVQISMAYDFSVDQLLKGDLGMLKHYEAQSANNRRQQRLVAISYDLVVGLLFLSYLHYFLHWNDGIVTMVINGGLIVMTTTLIMNYNYFDDWATTKRQAWQLVGVITMLAVLNIALVWPQLASQIPSNQFLNQHAGAYLAGNVSGKLVGDFLHLFIWTAAAVMAIEIPLNRARKTSD